MMFINQQSIVTEWPVNPTLFNIFSFLKTFVTQTMPIHGRKNGREVRDSIFGMAHVFTVLMGIVLPFI